MSSQRNRRELIRVQDRNMLEKKTDTKISWFFEQEADGITSFNFLSSFPILYSSLVMKIFILWTFQSVGSSQALFVDADTWFGIRWKVLECPFLTWVTWVKWELHLQSFFFVWPQFDVPFILSAFPSSVYGGCWFKQSWKALDKMKSMGNPFIILSKKVWTWKPEIETWNESERLQLQTYKENRTIHCTAVWMDERSQLTFSSRLFFGAYTSCVWYHSVAPDSLVSFIEFSLCTFFFRTFYTRWKRSGEQSNLLNTYTE